MRPSLTLALLATTLPVSLAFAAEPTSKTLTATKTIKIAASACASRNTGRGRCCQRRWRRRRLIRMCSDSMLIVITVDAELYWPSHVVLLP